MASARSGDAASGGFSYAQAAKGRSTSAPSTKPSSTGVSGTATPASLSMSEVTPVSNWADDGDQSSSLAAPSPSQGPPEVGDKNKPSDQTQVDAASQHSGAATTASADSKVDSVVKEESKGDKVASSDKVEKASEVSDVATINEGAVEEKKPPKPVYTEAKPPSVNIWAQRAAEAKAKAVIQIPTAPAATTPEQAPQPAPQPSRIASDGDRSRFDSRRKSEQVFNRKTEMPNRPRDDIRAPKYRRDSRPDEHDGQRRGNVKPRDRANSELPPGSTSEISWPRPNDVQDDEKKRQQQAEKDQASAGDAKPHGKTEWKKMAYTPTAVFETKVEGRGSFRMGKGVERAPPRGPPRGGQSISPSHDQVRAPRGQQMQNGGDNTGAAKTPRDGQITKTSSSDLQTPRTDQASASIPSQINGDKGFVPSAEIAEHTVDSHTVPPTQTSRSSNGGKGAADTTMQGHVTTSGTDAASDANTSADLQQQTPRSSYNDRRSEPHLYDSAREPGTFRETRRGGRKSGRGGFNHSFNAPNPYANGFSDFSGSQHPHSPTSTYYGNRGGSHGGRGIRNSAMRSQSIPLDAYGRQVGGFPPYQMGPPQPPFDIYPPYSAGPFPPQDPRDVLISLVLQQVEYYFSLENLLKDMFLRKHMDSQGWIFLQVIANFNRMKQITTDYEILKAACLQSQEIEIRTGEDGKDRLRKAREWEQWVLAKELRDASAQTDGPQDLRRPPPVRIPAFEQQSFHPQSPGSILPPSVGQRSEHAFNFQDAASASFYPSNMDPTFGAFSPTAEESRGRQVKPPRDNTPSPLTNGFGSAPATSQEEPDRFPDAQVESLTVVVRRHTISRPPVHSASSRTFSHGSIDSRSIMEEISSQTSPGQQSNGIGASNGDTPHSPSSPNAHVEADGNSALTLFWVKDKEAPVDVNTLPADTTHELYTFLRSRAIAQRDAAATGTCPYDLDVLYQFWSHFLIRNFNTHMYHEFKTLAGDDASTRHNQTGLNNLLKYYSEALGSQINIRNDVAHDFADLIRAESSRAERPGFKLLRSAWRNGSLNLKNRKKFSDHLDTAIKSELDG